MEKTTEKIPTWSLCYIVNGDASGLTEEEIQTIDRWYKGIGVQVVSPVMDDECGTQPYFSHYPAFGLPTEVVDCDIYDTMRYIKCDVSTICVGMAASMGAFLLAGGTKGKRMILPNAEVMIHQPSGGAQGQATEIQITAEWILRTKKHMAEILAANCGQPVEKVMEDTERDHWMTAQQALEYGIVDHIFESREAAEVRN